MSLEYQILGEPGRDNALLATIDSGQSIHRLLFDCGEGCLSQLPIAQVGEIEALFFSHFHMDHVAGFDSFVRVNWNRPDKPVRIFGPPGTIDVIHHRLRGFIWNLAADSPGEWLVTELGDGNCHTVRLLSAEGFALRHELEISSDQGPIYFGGCFEVHGMALDHGTPSIGYYVHEDERSNVAPERLKQLDLRPGTWLQAVKDEVNVSDEQIIDVHG
ncbi:MAG: ribonuclease Z, partial [Verrucomicrobiales bacterium]